MTYQLLWDGSVSLTVDDRIVCFTPGGSDSYSKEYADWLEAGNTPEPVNPVFAHLIPS